MTCFKLSVKTTLRVGMSSANIFEDNLIRIQIVCLCRNDVLMV